MLIESPEVDNLTTHLFSVHQAQRCRVLVVTSQRGVCRVELGAQREELVASAISRFKQVVAWDQLAESNSADSDFALRHRDLAEQVVEMVDQSKTAEADFPLDVAGTEFQKLVWEGLRSIPFGTTTTYQKLATQIGRPTSVRAVANACGANPVAVLIPCHRVLRTDGGIGGYRWGVTHKVALLSIEQSLPVDRQGELFRE